MKNLIALCFLFVITPAFAAIPDLPPDATSEDYLQYSKSAQVIKSFDPDDGLDEIIAAGVKNLQWLIKINGGRDENSHLSFTDADHRIGYPIDKPNEYSPSIIIARYQAYMAQMPESFRSIVSSDKDLPAVPPPDLSTKEYLDLGRGLDRIYQISTRWRMMAPYLQELADRAISDVRGYYFLAAMPDHETKLAQYSSLNSDEKTQFTAWLVQMCGNVGDLIADGCLKALTDSVAAENGSALKFYNTYVAGAKAHYDSYFQIPDGAARTDITWAHDAPNLTVIPFLDPMSDIFRKFMLNVEDEWHWGDWHLHLNFISPTGPTDSIPQLTFTPGATPHVNAVGGNIITMDQNTPLSDWEVNWTIRHEFGHILGFLDCYLEFYDVPSKTMVAYQLDLTNLMCSRKGNLKETHYNELKRIYFK